MTLSDRRRVGWSVGPSVIISVSLLMLLSELFFIFFVGRDADRPPRLSVEFCTRTIRSLIQKSFCPALVIAFFLRGQ